MHDIEPYFNWRYLYIASEDERSPFYEYFNSETEFTHTIYNHVIHPQWDFFGSRTLYLKILFADYDIGTAIIEFIGEWNDCIYNDIMYLKRDVIEPLIAEGINKFILIGENVLIFHADTYDYYQEWSEDIEDGWIAGINFRPQVISDFSKANLDYYINFGGELDQLPWRTMSPMQLFDKINSIIHRRLE